MPRAPRMATKPLPLVIDDDDFSHRDNSPSPDGPPGYPEAGPSPPVYDLHNMAGTNIWPPMRRRTVSTYYSSLASDDDADANEVAESLAVDAESAAVSAVLNDWYHHGVDTDEMFQRIPVVVLRPR